MIDIINESKGYVAHGVSACAGCGMELIIRNILDVLGQDTTVVIPPGCSALFCGFGKESGLRVSAFQGNLENSAAYAAGIRAISPAGETGTGSGRAYRRLDHASLTPQHLPRHPETDNSPAGGIRHFYARPAYLRKPLLKLSWVPLSNP